MRTRRTCTLDVSAASPARAVLPADPLSKMSWIPLPTRLRMLKREMEVFQINSSTHERLEKELVRCEPVLLPFALVQR